MGVGRQGREGCQRGHARCRCAGVDSSGALHVDELAGVYSLQDGAVPLHAKLLAGRPRRPAIAIKVQAHALDRFQMASNLLGARNADACTLYGADLRVPRSRKRRIGKHRRQPPPNERNLRVAEASIKLLVKAFAVRFFHADALEGRQDGSSNAHYDVRVAPSPVQRAASLQLAQLLRERRHHAMRCEASGNVGDVLPGASGQGMPRRRKHAPEVAHCYASGMAAVRLVGTVVHEVAQRDSKDSSCAVVVDFVLWAMLPVAHLPHRPAAPLLRRDCPGAHE